jgi:hypothetical protein
MSSTPPSGDTPVTNPTTFTITDPDITSDNVTGFQVLFGQTSGGPYTLTAQVPQADIDAATGVASGTLAGLNQQLAPGTWYAVAQAINAAGDSPNSPEVEIVITPALPHAPTGFSVE